MAGEQRTCGSYALVERIAKGGMAEVYLGRTTGVFGVDRLVAVKMLLPMRAESKQIVAMFIDEARLAVELTHVNIVQIFELGVSEGRYYIAMEYVPGADLAEILRRVRNAGQPMPIAHAVYIAYCVCAALDYAHSRKGSDGAPLNIVHRDVSPQNVLIGDEGGVKVADFGIALSNMRLTQTIGTKLKGKVCYMSPEQAWGRKLDARSDLFSLGTILYEILTGEVPFDGKTELEVVYKVRDCRVTPPRELRPDIPADLEALVLRAMSQDPDERFADAEAMHAALEPLLLIDGKPFGARDLRDFVGGLRADEAEEERRHLDDLLAAPDAVVEVEAPPADWSDINVTQIIEEMDMELDESAILAVHQPWAAETGLRSIDGEAVERAELNRQARALPQVLMGEDDDDDEPVSPRRTASGIARMPTQEVNELIGAVGTDVFEEHIDEDGIGVAVVGGRSKLEGPAPAPVVGEEEWTVPDSGEHRLSLPSNETVDRKTPEPVASSGPGPSRRKLWAAAAVAALGAGIVLGVVWMSPEQKPSGTAETETSRVSAPLGAANSEPPIEESPPLQATRADVVRLRRGLASLLRGRGLTRGDSSELDEWLVRLAVAVDAEEWTQAYEYAEAAMTLANELEVSVRMVRGKLVRMERRAERIEDDRIRERLEAAIIEGRALLEEGEVKEANLRLHAAIVEGFAAARGEVSSNGPAGDEAPSELEPSESEPSEPSEPSERSPSEPSERSPSEPSERSPSEPSESGQPPETEPVSSP